MSGRPDADVLKRIAWLFFDKAACLVEAGDDERAKVLVKEAQSVEVFDRNRFMRLLIAAGFDSDDVTLWLLTARYPRALEHRREVISAVRRAGVDVDTFDVNPTKVRWLMTELLKRKLLGNNVACVDAALAAVTDFADKSGISRKHTNDVVDRFNRFQKRIDEESASSAPHA